jgi:hypothetical protein
MTAVDRRATPWQRSWSTGDGRSLVRLSWAGTLVSCATAIANALTGSRTEFLLSAIPGLVMFTLGSVAFLAAFLIAVQRSREEAIGVGGLYFLAGCAPAAVQRSMMASVAVQTVVPLVVTVIRPFVAFSVLAPMWSLGLAGLWGALHGTFPPKVDPDAVADEDPAPVAEEGAGAVGEAAAEGPRSADPAPDGPDFGSDGRGTEAPRDG